MKFLITILVFVTLSVISVFGQNSAEKSTVCTNETARKISSRGISIGANIDVVIDLFDLTEERKQNLLTSPSGTDYDLFNYKFFGISPNPNPQRQNERFVGISDYNFSFLDGQLTGFYVKYTKPVWRNIEQFTAKMAEIFDLPEIKNWNSESSGRLSLQCGNYTIRTVTEGQSTLSIYDNRIEQILAQRRRKAADEQLEKDLKTFKP